MLTIIIVGIICLVAGGLVGYGAGYEDGQEDTFIENKMM